jgi:hypothetical protein
MINDEVDLYIRPIGPFTLKPKCSFMVNFHKAFHALLFSLGGLNPI